MYDFKLNKKETVHLISDNTLIYIEKDIKKVTSIITNKRLLILDYPSAIHNSYEDLRISGKMNYIRKKEVISEINLIDIVSITKMEQYYKIELNDGYINLEDDEIVKCLKKVFYNEQKN